MWEENLSENRMIKSNFAVNDCDIYIVTVNPAPKYEQLE